MTECIKTGALVYLDQYDETIITDLMETGDCYHFRIATADHISRGRSKTIHLTVTSLDFPRRAGREVVVPKAACVYHGYDGEAI